MDNQLKIQLQTGFWLIWSQIKAMLIKRWAYTYRNPLLFVVTNFIVLLFAVLAMFVANSLLKRPDLPNLKLDLDFYGQTTTLFEVTEKAENEDLLLP